MFIWRYFHFWVVPSAFFSKEGKEDDVLQEEFITLEFSSKDVKTSFVVGSEYTFFVSMISS